MSTTTYEWILKHDDGPWSYEQPCWVFTHRDPPPKEGPTTGSPRLRRQRCTPRWWRWRATGTSGFGGGELVGQFLDVDLLDEMVVSLTPVLLGAGAPLLPRRRTEPMGLLSATPSPAHTFVHLHYSLR